MGVSTCTASVAEVAIANASAPRRERPRVTASTSLYLISRLPQPTYSFMPSPVPGRDATIVADLTHNAVIRVSGDDAAAFLHGQFTNDVESLAAGAAQWSGWCTPKGRLLATFLLVRRADDFLMLLPAEIAEPVRKRLTMFVLRSKAKLEDVTAATARLGVAGPAAARAIGAGLGHEPAVLQAAQREGATCVRLDAARFVVLAPAESAATLRAALGSGTVPSGVEAWDAAGIRAGVPTVLAATQEAFVPQMVNYELIGGVSFKKGCYPGQEIVARMHYRGGLKRRMALAHFSGPEAPQPGDELFSAAFQGQSAGQVANAAPSPEGGFDALVVAQLESLDRRDLRWKSPDGTLVELRDLPYAVTRP